MDIKIIILIILVILAVVLMPLFIKSPKDPYDIIGTYDNGDTFNYELLEGYDLILATWSTPDNDPNEHYTVIFKPTDLLLGHCFRTQIQNNPIRLGCLNHITDGVIKVGVINSINQVDSTFNGTVTLTGIKL
jgi:hypothetical protein